MWIEKASRAFIYNTSTNSFFSIQLEYSVHTRIANFLSDSDFLGVDIHM